MAPNSRVAEVYWPVSNASIRGLLVRVRTALADLVAELITLTPQDQEVPDRRAADHRCRCRGAARERGLVGAAAEAGRGRRLRHHHRRHRRRRRNRRRDMRLDRLDAVELAGSLLCRQLGSGFPRGHHQAVTGSAGWAATATFGWAVWVGSSSQLPLGPRP